MGSSLAYHLAAARGTGEGIVVIERDSSYKVASAMLSAGGIRQQFSLRENVQMSMYGIDFLKRSAALLAVDDDAEPVDVQFQERGYLFLASAAGHETLRRNHATQVGAGAHWIELLDPDELRARFPWLRLDGVVAGSLGTANEGWFDPWGLLRGMRRKATALGVTYVEGRPVGATVDAATKRVLSVDVASTSRSSGGEGGGVLQFRPARAVANAAGAHAAAVLSTLAGAHRALDIPVRPRKRCIFHLRCPPPPDQAPWRAPGTTPLWHAPLTVDPSGVYFRPEGASSTETYLCGVSPDAPYDEDVWDADGLAVSESDHTRLFEETIWPVLYNRAEAFGEMKVLGSSEDAVLMTSNGFPLMTSDCLPHQVLGSWAGWYEYNTFDQNAIIGWHPDLPNVVHLNGFSGHGLQHAPAAGRAVAELVEHGAFRTLDLSLFSFDRVMEGRPVLETGIV